MRLKICENLRIASLDPKFTGSYKKKCIYFFKWYPIDVTKIFLRWFCEKRLLILMIINNCDVLAFAGQKFDV